MSLTRQDLDRLEKEALSCVGDYDCGYLAPDVLQLIPMARRSLELEEEIAKYRPLINRIAEIQHDRSILFDENKKLRSGLEKIKGLSEYVFLTSEDRVRGILKTAVDYALEALSAPCEKEEKK